jgi:hypothetical protein
MNPQRIQLRRTKGWRKPEGAVVVARPSKWGNPWRVGHPVTHRSADRTWRSHMTAGDVVSYYEADLRVGDLRFTVDDVRRELAGRDLACWCPLDDEQGRRVPCHADVLLELANGGVG